MTDLRNYADLSNEQKNNDLMIVGTAIALLIPYSKYAFISVEKCTTEPIHNVLLDAY